MEHCNGFHCLLKGEFLPGRVGQCKGGGGGGYGGGDVHHIINIEKENGCKFNNVKNVPLLPRSTIFFNCFRFQY